MVEINYWAVLVCAVAAMVLGFIWYGPLFGNTWMRGMGIDPNDKERKAKMQKQAGPAYLQTFIGALLTAFVLAHVLWAYGIALPEVQGTSAGLQGAFWLWLGLILPVKYGDKLWSGKAFKYVAVDLSYHLLLLLVMGVILANWM